MARELKVLRIQTIAGAIHFVRSQKVRLDPDLAAIYGVTTAQLNQSLRRNRERFPAQDQALKKLSDAIRELLNPSLPEGPHRHIEEQARNYRISTYSCRMASTRD